MCELQRNAIGEMFMSLVKVMRTFGRVVVANMIDRVADNFLVVHYGLRGDLPAQQDHAGFCHGF